MVKLSKFLSVPLAVAILFLNLEAEKAVVFAADLDPSAENVEEEEAMEQEMEDQMVDAEAEGGGGEEEEEEDLIPAGPPPPPMGGMGPRRRSLPELQPLGGQRSPRAPRRGSAGDKDQIEALQAAADQMQGRVSPPPDSDLKTPERITGDCLQELSLSDAAKVVSGAVGSRTGAEPSPGRLRSSWNAFSGWWRGVLRRCRERCTRRPANSAERKMSACIKEKDAEQKEKKNFLRAIFSKVASMFKRGEKVPKDADEPSEGRWTRFKTRMREGMGRFKERVASPFKRFRNFFRRSAPAGSRKGSLQGSSDEE